MCLLSFSWQPQSNTPLTLVSNRDEFHKRPTATSAFWEDYPQVLAGKDLEAGGTWMGVTADGKFAALTNVRQIPSPYKGTTTRGNLVKDYLTGALSPEAYLLSICGENYDGFNLIVGNRSECWYLGNRQLESTPKALTPGVYGLSNASLDTPWPKTEYAKQQLQEWLSDSDQQDLPLYSLLNNQNKYQADRLPNTGIGEPWESLLSSAFIVSPEYGTRSCTGLRIHQSSIEWQEATINPNGERVLLTDHYL